MRAICKLKTVPSVKCAENEEAVLPLGHHKETPGTWANCAFVLYLPPLAKYKVFI